MRIVDLVEGSDPEFVQELRTIRSGLPRGSKFTWELRPDGSVYLDVLRIPRTSRGIGTDILARIVGALDRYGVPAELIADQSDEPDDPSTPDLVRWYRRFGFRETGQRDRYTDSPVMVREPRSPRGHDAVLADYEQAKAEGGPIRPRRSGHSA